MKATATRWIPAIGVAAAAAGVAFCGPPVHETTEAKIGEPAPGFTLADSSGEEHSLADYKGRIVVLEWINPRCPYVQDCYKSKATQQAYEEVTGLTDGVVWLAVNTTKNTSTQENDVWIRQFELDYPILLDNDGTVGHLYDARRTPHMFVIDRDGVLRYQGAFSNNPMSKKPADETVNYVVQSVRQIVAGETVSPDYVKPWGCSVKYQK